LCSITGPLSVKLGHGPPGPIAFGAYETAATCDFKNNVCDFQNAQVCQVLARYLLPITRSDVVLEARPWPRGHFSDLGLRVLALTTSLITRSSDLLNRMWI
jgi:hypothetical protein